MPSVITLKNQAEKSTGNLLDTFCSLSLTA